MTATTGCQVEDYVASNSEAKFSHSICPECLSKYYPEFAKSYARPDDENAT